MNAYGKFEAAVLTAIFDLDEADPSALEQIPFSVRLIAEFVEQNGVRATPFSFDTVESFKGAYRQWNILRERAIDAARNPDV